VDWSIRRSIAHFGALEQFFTQLSELNRDLHHGRCHLPLHVLATFGLAPQDLLSESCRRSRRYVAMMRYWLDHYLPTLRFEAAEFAQLEDLPRALRLMRDACLQRQARIEKVFRECRFDFVASEVLYWSQVEASCSVRLAAAS
jgi:phytoene/squalene synthetase